jgi:hypothetical protein
MNHHTTLYSGTAVIAPAGVGIGAAACGSTSASSGPGNGSSANGSSAKYYQERYRYARANISPSQYQILSHSGYAKWCAGASSATNELKNMQAGHT